ncbi:MAG TPA: alcohol dehydrogenase catalytic domain-containing protein [Planctomycetota bacterium]
MPTIEFDAQDYRADQSFARARYRLEGETAHGWRVYRDGALALELGPGYRPLRVRQCGVCSTDLARHHLPFPLPQVTGHEVIALDDAGRRYVVEINASHTARGVPNDCAFCRAGLHTHCPERIVLGIHDLPGGFGPWILAPVQACIEIPSNVPDSAAVLVEPFAAALNAVHTIAPRDGDRIAVLGPRRLGMLVVAALAGVRAQRRAAGGDFAIAAVARDPAMLELARTFGATEAHQIGGRAEIADGSFDVVIDTTGNPQALGTAVRLARREVHVKSTHGQPSNGLGHLTELVVDELALARFPDEAPAPGTAVWERDRTGSRPRIAWLAPVPPPEWLTASADVQVGDAAALARHYAAARDGLPRADAAVVTTGTQADAAIRPLAGRQESLVRPRGTILFYPTLDVAPSALLGAIVARGLRLTSSRCGDFHQALALLAGDAELRRIGERLVTNHFRAGDLSRAFATARSRECIKAVVDHDVVAAPAASPVASSVASATSRHEIPTSLGPALVPGDGCWVLDVTSLPALHGLSVLSRALAEMVIAQARSDRIDVMIERSLRDRENPELIEDFGIELVKLAADVEATATILARPDLLETRLRSLLGSLQRTSYRDALLPQARAGSKALVAEFGDGETRQRYVLEHLHSRREPARGAFRITIEAGSSCRLDLQTIPHLRIERVEDRHFIAGSTRIAQTWAESLRREAERGRRSFLETRSPHSHLFRQLDQAGLASIGQVALHWSESALPFLLENDPAEVSELLKRVLLTLEDRGVRELLAGREVVRVDAGGVPVFLDRAQLGRVLLLSLGQRRERADAAAFLQRMPALTAVAGTHTNAQPLRGVKVFLVHHMTGEVVGLIAALRALGCRDLTCLFVAYAGEPPASYLDAILDLPPDEFRALALVHVPDRGRVEGHYRLSTQYSRLDEAAEIEAALRGHEAHYLEAMRAVAIVPFLRQIARAEATGERCLLLEDGGYLAPVVQEALLQGLSVQAFAAPLGHAVADARPLAALLGERMLGTIEHTRNGFDRLTEVERRHGRLALPSFSIAISRRKRIVEAREVATSVLGAVETVLNAGGRILSRRSCLVLGSRGAIGAELCRALGTRLDAPEQGLAGIDRVVKAACRDAGYREAASLAELPAQCWLDADVVIGVTGDSVLKGADIERWLAEGQKDALVLASASTKKVEFRDVMEWFDGLLRSDQPRIAGRPVAIAVEELLDPRTARVYGHRWCFQFVGGRSAAIWALGHLTPINFLFYGVATELIDEVLGELMSLTLGAVRRAGEGVREPRLLAVDRDVDANAVSLVPRPVPVT